MKNRFKKKWFIIILAVLAIIYIQYKIYIIKVTSIGAYITGTDNYVVYACEDLNDEREEVALILDQYRNEYTEMDFIMLKGKQNVFQFQIVGSAPDNRRKVLCIFNIEVQRNGFNVCLKDFYILP